ncbi:enoyl-CoA hydratase-related protein [Pseudomonas sp. PDM31]|uniref:enoyl-CoA hydratase-related protein n=1 Tax=Pseudomonas sp. PDM31 TaxID=2854778 RepID=UPI001C48C247|nr:enoyl-CoA hydratase-related protein [Pseudomonas sp. PDM31]MBV7477553.1 enoyl-CoA hydratase/isomerase family protein [Pseudomonas sp. PDM31]
MSEYIRVESHQHCLTITLNRPDKYNALTNAMYDSLSETLKAAGVDDDVRVVVITGGPECFTAGNDLADFLQAPPKDLDAPAFRFMAAVVALDKPLIAAVCGAAIGIGTTLLPHCDLVMATRNSRFATPFVKLGLCQEFAASLLLPQRLGHGYASRLLLGGEGIDGEQAHAQGLCTHLFDKGQDCLAFARDYAERLATASPGALQTAKRLMKAPLRDSVLGIIKEENQNFIARLQAPECRQALEDFVNKRR